MQIFVKPWEPLPYDKMCIKELFLMFAKDHQITEVLTMLPDEVKPLIDMVITQCNANPVEERKEIGDEE